MHGFVAHPFIARGFQNGVCVTWHFAPNLFKEISDLFTAVQNRSWEMCYAASLEQRVALIKRERRLVQNKRCSPWRRWDSATALLTLSMARRARPAPGTDRTLPGEGIPSPAESLLLESCKHSLPSVPREFNRNFFPRSRPSVWTWVAKTLWQVTTSNAECHSPA